MGYTTEFSGKFNLDKKLDASTNQLLNDLATTRRMKRNPAELARRLNLTTEEVLARYGEECHLWCGDKADFGQLETSDIVDYNCPPSVQPGLWLQWIPTKDGMGIKWDGNEKFYRATAWLQYLIDYILQPRGYVLNGIVDAQGEDRNDIWRIDVRDNVIHVADRMVIYKDEQEFRQ